MYSSALFLFHYFILITRLSSASESLHCFNTHFHIHEKLVLIAGATLLHCLIFVLVEQNAVTVAVKLKKMCVNMNKGRGYVMVYRSKKRQVYKEYEDNIRCDRTVVRYILPLCSLIGTMNKQWRFKQCNNVAPAIRTSLSWIWKWLLKQCND